MCMGSKHWHIKQLSGQHIGRTDTATDHSCSCSVGTRIRSLSTAQSKLHDAISSGRIDYSCRLGGDQTLMVDHGKNCGLHQLCLHDRCDNFHQRFSRKYHSSFRDCINITCEVKTSQVFQEILFKDSQAVKIRYIFI